MYGTIYLDASKILQLVMNIQMLLKYAHFMLVVDQHTFLHFYCFFGFKKCVFFYNMVKLKIKHVLKYQT